MSSYEEDICDAVQILIDKALAKLEYNKTITCIVKSIDADGKRHQVTYQDSIFYAYPIDTSESYPVGTSVIVLILNGDMSKKKFIIGKEATAST